MPIYEYVCEACGRLTEVMQKIGDPPPASCGECGGTRLAKLVSRTSFQLKGGGWYADLYSSAGKGKAGEGAASGSPAPATKDAAPAKKDAPAATPGSGGTGTTGTGGAKGG